MKPFFAGIILSLISVSAFGSRTCQTAAENAVYKKWYNPNAWAMGDIQAGATDVVWERDGLVSYQVSVQYGKPDSNALAWANYSVRVRSADCRVVSIRKF